MKIILAVCLCFLLACNGTAHNTPPAATDTAASLAALKEPDTTTLGGDWILQPVLASDTASGKAATIRFDLTKTHFSGNTGCNPMGGTFWYSNKDSSLSFNDKFVTTKMNCTGYNEQGFIKSLMNTNHYRLKKGMLILMSDNTELSRWIRKGVALPKTEKA